MPIMKVYNGMEKGKESINEKLNERERPNSER